MCERERGMGRQRMRERKRKKKKERLGEDNYVRFVFVMWLFFFMLVR